MGSEDLLMVAYCGRYGRCNQGCIDGFWTNRYQLLQCEGLASCSIHLSPLLDGTSPGETAWVIYHYSVPHHTGRSVFQLICWLLAIINHELTRSNHERWPLLSTKHQLTNLSSTLNPRHHVSPSAATIIQPSFSRYSAMIQPLLFIINHRFTMAQTSTASTVGAKAVKKGQRVLAFAVALARCRREAAQGRLRKALRQNVRWWVRWLPLMVDISIILSWLIIRLITKGYRSVVMVGTG